jgi:hypothetical protein
LVFSSRGINCQPAASPAQKREPLAPLGCVKDLSIAPLPNKTTCWLLKGHRAKSKLEIYGPLKTIWQGNRGHLAKGEIKKQPISQAEVDRLFSTPTSAGWPSISAFPLGVAPFTSS